MTTARQQLKELLERRKRSSALRIAPVGDAAPSRALSYGQQRLWFLSQYLGPNAIYNLPLALRLRGEVNEAALVRSLGELQQRHESLRTRFEARDAGVVQVIDPPEPVKVEPVSAAEVQAIAHAERFHAFDLSCERLCRIRLLREIGGDGNAGDHVLLATMHHSVTDGWSLGIFFQELVSLYQAYSNGEGSPLAPLPIQYADYAQWQRQWLQGEVLERQLSYWRAQLEGLAPVLTLPMSRPRPAEQAFRGRTEHFALPLVLSEKLQALSRDQGVTLFMTLLPAFAILLGRYAGQDDVAIGTPIANRARRETEGLIGFFVNTLVMRHDLRGDPRFVDLLECTRTMALQAYAHQDVPFERLVEELNPGRSVSHAPLFQVMFALQNAPFEARELSGLAMEPLRFAGGEDQEGTARFDLTLNMQESPAGLMGGLEYDTDLFDRGTVLRLLENYARLLEAIVAAPQARLSQLNMLSAGERQRQVVEWNASASRGPRSESVHALFEEQVDLHPTAVAVADDARRITYRELNERANALAHCLIARRVAPGSLLGLCVDSDVERAVGLLGILKAGGACVPLNPADPAERVDYLLEDSDVELIVTPAWMRAEFLKGHPLTNPGVAVSASHLAYVRYEADEEGVPAGRMVLHSDVLAASDVSAALLARLASSAEVSGVAHYVLDRHGELLPVGAVGELHVGGEGVGPGYLQRAGRTAERFLPDAFGRVPGARLHRTGERARWTESGKLERVGQQTDVASGRAQLHHRVGIERALLGHEGVLEAVVVAPDPARLVAYVVERAPGAMPAERFVAQLKTYLRTAPLFSRLPDEWMVLDALPRTAAGAVDRSGLPQPKRAGPEHVAPRTQLERTLAEVWQEQLGIDRVGVEDNYFALGGDSIRSIAVVTQARRSGVGFSIKDLFAHPTVSALAAAIERGDVGSHLDGGQKIEPFALLAESERERLSQRHELEDAFPLSMMQQGMVLESLRHEHLNVYLNFQIYEFKDSWDPQMFERALRYLLAKHPMLRTIHELSAERPLQLVLKEKAPDLTVVDVRHLDRTAIRAALDQWMERERSLGLDTTVSLWRAAVHVLPGSQFVFGMHLHHALWDGWSLESFATELYATYGLLKRDGRLPEYRPLPSYRQFVALEQAALSSESHRSYWSRKLEGATVPWWTGREKSASAFFICEISEQTSHTLTELARSLGVQEKSVWCSVYLALLSLLSGTEEGLGTVVTQGRPEIPDGEKIIGVFLNALPTRVRISGRRWADLITATDRELAGQHAFRHYPLAEIQRLTALDLSAAMFNYTNFHVYYDGVDGKGTREEWIPQKIGGWQDTNHLLSVFAHKDDKAQRYYVSIAADAQVFDARFRERIRGYVANIVAAIAGDATALIEKTSLLGDEERQQQLLEWNATARAYPHDKCIHELFEEQARQSPDRIALVHAGRELTYGELNRRSSRLAHRLIERGVGPEVRVGLCLPRSPEMVIGILGILKAGGCYVPLDPDYPRRRLDYLLADARIELVVTEPGVAACMTGPGRELLFLDEAEPLQSPASAADLGLRPEHPAYLIYTSASTGAPKGVLGLHRSIVNRVSWLAGSSGVDTQAVLCQKTSLGFVDHVAEIFQALSAGVPLVIIAPSALQAPRELLCELDARRVSQLTLVPSLLKAVLESAEGQAARWLKSIHSSGEALHLSGLQRFSACFPLATLFNIYGSTEMGADVTCQAVQAESLQSAGQWAPIGKGIDNTAAYVLDTDGQLAVAGAVGELHVGGVCLSRGYFRRAGLTAEKFVPNAFARTAGERLYRTGDLARRLADGTLEYLGRVDTQVKVRGFRIELGEIENVLRAHEAVRDAVVVAREQSGDQRLVGYVVAKPAAQTDDSTLIQELRGRLLEQLPGYMVPSAFVVLESLPLTATGKLDRMALPAPEASAPATYAAPEDVTEELLAQLWCALLKRERVGRNDNFFELGGHSLLATQLVSRIRAAFSTDLPMRQLFEHPTLSSQARAIELARGAGARVEVAMAAVSREQPLPLSYAQQRLWFLHQFMGPSAVYNMPLALRLRGEVNEPALARSLKDLCRRHESLRTRFETRDDHVVQVIDTAEPELEVEAVSAAEAQAISHWERSYHFDLARERLCRIRLLRETNGESADYVLLVTMHHSVSDGWSLGIFFRELVSLYRAYLNGESSPLAELSIQYADYAQWQRRWLQGGVLEEQVAYWRRQLAGLPPLLLLPTDRPRPARQTFHGRTEHLALPLALTERLQALSRAQGVTLYMTLLSAFAVLLGRYSEQEDVALGTPIANRTRRETEGLIGFFVNTLVMRCDLSGDPRVVELLTRTRETALQAYAHQDVPFEQLVEELNPHRALSHSPLFQVAFGLVNTPVEAVELPGAAVLPLWEESVEDQEGTARFDLTLNVQESAAGLVGVLEYNADLFDRGTSRRLLGHYARLLAAMVAAPQARLSQLSMLGEDERQRQLVEWNADASNHPRDRSVHAQFEEQADLCPDAIAVVDEGRHLTYREINERANRLAHRLIGRGVGLDARVAICAGNDGERAVGVLGVLKAGGAYVPLNADDPAERRDYLLEDSDVELMLTQACLSDGDLRGYPSTNPGVAVAASALACVQYEADEAGVPAGRMVPHAGAHTEGWITPLLARVASGATAEVRSAAHYILDRHGELLPVGAVGDLYVGGEAAGWGYLHRPELTAERFVADAFSQVPGARLHRTGARARWLHDGTLELVGPQRESRRDYAQREDTVEIERALCGHEAVREAAVLALEVAQGEPRLTAYVVEQAPGAMPAERFVANLKAHLRAQPTSHRLPDEWLVLTSLPRNANGMVDRKALPAPDASACGLAYAPPEGLSEELLAPLWCALLERERVGRYDNFFQLGGHSLLATQLASRIRETFSIELPVRDLFEHATLAAQAGAIDAARGAGALLDVAMEAVSRDQPLPLSYAQQRLWFLHQYLGPNAVYNMPLALRLQGEVNEAALVRSLGELHRRHESLRTRFETRDGNAVQVIDPPELELAVEAVQAAEVQAIVHAERNHCFDLSRERLCRIRLLRESGGYVLLVTMHHSVSDGWSLGIFFREMVSSYRAFANGESSPLAPLPLQYADYAQWQRRRLQGELLEQQLSYWRAQLKELPPLLTLPTDRPRPAEQTFRGRTDRFALPSALSGKLRTLSREHGATLYMTLLSAFATLLSRYSGQQDVAVGTPIANRTRRETEGLIGFFVNTLVMRHDLSGDPRFTELLGRTRQTALQAYAHQDVPFEQLVEELNPQRSVSHPPLFQVMFILQNTPFDAQELPGIALQPLLDDAGESREGAARFDLTLNVQETPACLVGSIEYNTDLFERGTIRRMWDHYARLLDAIAAAPQARLSQLQMLGDEEQRQQLIEWNATARVYHQDLCIHQLFEEQARLRPDAVALVYEGGALTYGELDLRANRLAHRLIERGVRPATLVGLCMQRSAEMVIGLLGILKAGGAYVPLDPGHPQQRLAYAVEDSGLDLMVGDPSQWLFLDPAQRPGCLTVEDGGASDASRDNPGVHPPADALAYVIYTSGSTGKPKGVRISHGNVVNFLLGMREKLGIGSGDRLLAVTTLSFDIALLELYLPLTVGATVDIAPAASVVDGERLMARLEESRITLLQATPVTWKLLLDSGWQGLRRLTALVGGEAFPRELALRLLGKVGRIWNLYGPTETTIWSTCSCVEAVESSTVSIGKPIANTQLYVLDEQRQLVPAGTAGQLYLAGAGVSQGYQNRPGLTADKFIPHSFSARSGDRLYGTGDLARWLPDGTLEFLGRVDNQVKVRGFRIELGEIENVLLAHEGVRDAVVVVREDAGDKRLVGYVVAESGADTNEAILVTELRARLREQLPGYMVPSAVMVLGSLPLTANGKIDRKALPAPEASAPVEYTAPEGPTEEMLAALWCALLGRERVGRHENFFERGGHSLLATQLVSRIRETFSTGLPVRQVFEHPTLASQARAVERARGAGAPLDLPMEAVSRDEPLPLSYAQQRLWFLQQYMGPNAVYNMPLALRLQGEVNEAALVQSLRELYRRHESLRTRFESRDGSAVQVIDPPALELLVEAVRACEVEAIACAERNHCFDLSSERLCRIRLLRETGSERGDYALLVTMHHSVSDGWSFGIVIRELVNLYRAYANGEDSPLAPLPIQYADYAQWQRRWLQGTVLEEQVSYWRERLAGLPPLLTLPTDRPRPSEQTFRGRTEHFVLPMALSEKLQTLSREQGVTLFMTLLTGWAALLGRYAGQQDVAIGTPIANRTRRETEGLIGFFVNTLVTRHDLSGDPRFIDLLGHTRETALQAYAHQDVPFEQLVEALNPARSVSHSPLFQVMFALQNASFEAHELTGLTVQPLSVGAAGDDREGAPEGTARFDLTLNVQETAAGLSGVLEYNTDLFERGTIRRLLDHYGHLLEAIVAAPQTRLSRIEILGGHEQRQQLVEWNATSRAYPQEKCIHELFEEQARLQPDAVALVHEGGELSYAELNRRANELAHRLIECGVGPEVRVGVCLRRSAEMVIGLLGVLKAGGCYVPLDPSYPRKRLEYLLCDSAVNLIVSHRAVQESLDLERLGAEAGRLYIRVVNVDLGADGSSQPSTNPATAVNPANLAYVIYTSGSTGKPKGVGIAHRSAVSLLSWSAGQWPARDRMSVLASTSICFDLSIYELFLPLTQGGECVLIDSILALNELPQRERVSLINTVPSAAKALLERGGLPKSLRVMNLAGEPLKPALVDALYESTTAKDIYDLYGPSESTTYSTYALRSAQGRETIGRPVANTDAYVLDAERELLPSGVVGELYLGGVGLARGYLNRPAATAEKFVPHRFSTEPGERLYRTGDLARWLPDGTLEYLGRVDHQVKVRGYRIELGEIESALRAHEAVRDAVVVAREESSGSKRLVGYVVAQVGADADAKTDEATLVNELRSRLQEQLPGYMVPSTLMVLPSLPLTANGKLDRNALPAPEQSTSESAFVPPQGPTEELLAALWCALLNRERVGRHENFFELGGHSLLAMQLVSRIRETFSTELPVRELFEHATLTSLASAIEIARGAGACAAIDLPMEAVSRDEPLPLSYAQQRLWFLQQYMGANAVYNMPLALRLQGEVNEAALVRSLLELNRRHESLRTRFETRNGSAVQVIDPPGLELEVRAVSATDAQAIARSESSHCFDLSSERLCRIRLLRETDSESGDHVLLVTMHHSVSDAWSLGIFFREFVSLYRAYANGQSLPLTPLPIQYADYAQWQRRWLQGEVQEQQLSYWREQLKELPPLLTLPTDRPRPSEQTFHGSTERFALPALLSEKLRSLSREQGVTLYMTLLSTFAVLLGRYSGQQDVAVGTPIANRTRRETEGLIGFFVNTLVMRHDLSGDPRFIDLLKRTRETALQAYAHQDIPFEHLVEELNPERSVSHSPLFQVAFGLLNTPFEAVELQGVSVQPLTAIEGEKNPQDGLAGAARFDLTLNVQESPAGLLGGLEYNTDLFDRGTIRTLLDHYAQLLAAIVAAPAARISQLEMLNDDERHRQIFEWNATATNFRRGKTIHALFEELAERSPQAIAAADGERQLTYREINERANQLAHRLIKRAVEPDARVAICIEQGVDRAVGVLGILKAGGAYVPLDDGRVERLDHLLEDSGAELIVTQSWVRDEVLRGHPNTNPGVAASDAALACVRYESHEADAPLGRMISHSGLVEMASGHGEMPSEGWLESLFTWPMDWSASVAEHARAQGASRYVLDRHGELLPIGATGDLYVGGDAAGWGYSNRSGHRSSLTAERFIPNAFSVIPGERLYRTCAAARWTIDGKLELVDREPVSSASPTDEWLQIEQALCSHEAVREAAVVALQTTHSEPRLVAYVVERVPGAMPARQFIAQLKAQLRSLPILCPLPHEWVVLETLPRTAAGAVDRSGLPRPKSAGPEYVAPRTELERTLVEVWQQQLGIERVGVEDNYFASGGDSIRSIALVSQARQHGIDFSIKDLFAHPTVSALAAAIERGEVRSVFTAAPSEPFALLTAAERDRLGQRDGLEDAYPLSMMQQGMVFEALRHAHLGVYLNFQIYEFRDSWDPQLFQQALRHLLVRHSMLRTIHDFSGERPLQLVMQEPASGLKVFDARDLNKAALQKSLEQWVQSEQSLGLDTTLSLWRAAVHVLPGERFLLGMHLHHALWDGWSLESFVTELYATYGLLKKEGRVAEHRPLPSYQQFVALEQAALSSEAHRSYWIRKLAGATVPWWTGREKSASALIPCEISEQTSQALIELARRLGVQEKSVWCSVYLALLSLLSGTDEVIGPVMTQGRPEIPGGEKMVGVFLNALPMRADMSGRWVDLIAQTDRDLTEQHAFRHYPLAEIQRLAGLDFSAAMFNYTNWHVYYEGVDREGTREEWIPQKVGGWHETNYLLCVFVHKDDKTQRHQLNIGADAQVFDAEFRERMSGYVANIIRSIAADATAAIEKTALLSDGEQRQQLVEWNATSREYPQEKCIHQLFEEQARLQPDAVALVHEGGELSYAELNRRANELAHRLIGCGVGLEVRVGLCLQRSAEMVIGLLGVLKAGGCYVPLDPSYPRKRLEYLLCDSAVNLIVSHRAVQESLDLERLGAEAGRLYIRVVNVVEVEGTIQPSTNPATAVNPANLAYVIYTSGSTGKPKGVGIAHRSAVSLLSWSAGQWPARDRMSVLASTSICFDLSIYELFLPLTQGGECVLIDSILGLNELPQRERVSLINTVPSAAKALLERGGLPKSLRVMNLAGEPLKPALVDALYESSAAACVYDLYGPSESTTYSTYALRSAQGRETIGRPVANTDAYVLDAERELLPSGVVGELYLGGVGLARGYLNRPAATAEKFVPQRFSTEPGERLYRTGDLARWLPDGTLEYLGRVDHQVKVRGYRIELGEIESALRAHEAVRDAVVVAREESSGSKRLVGYLVAQAGVQAGATLIQALRSRLQEQLPGYMVPSTLMVLPSLPLTANGKLDRKALPAPEQSTFESAFVPPKGPTEELLAALWCALLNRERVGRYDDFFEIGGHSLLAMQLLSRIRASFQVELPVRDLFDRRTLQEQALAIEAQGSDLHRRFEMMRNTLAVAEQALDVGEI